MTSNNIVESTNVSVLRTFEDILYFWKLERGSKMRKAFNDAHARICGHAVSSAFFFDRTSMSRRFFDAIDKMQIVVATESFHQFNTLFSAAALEVGYEKIDRATNTNGHLLMLRRIKRDRAWFIVVTSARSMSEYFKFRPFNVDRIWFVDNKIKGSSSCIKALESRKFQFTNVNAQTDKFVYVSVLRFALAYLTYPFNMEFHAPKEVWQKIANHIFSNRLFVKHLCDFNNKIRQVVTTVQNNSDHTPDLRVLLFSLRPRSRNPDFQTKVRFSELCLIAASTTVQWKWRIPWNVPVIGAFPMVLAPMRDIPKLQSLELQNATTLLDEHEQPIDLLSFEILNHTTRTAELQLPGFRLPASCSFEQGITRKHIADFVAAGCDDCFVLMVPTRASYQPADVTTTNNFVAHCLKREELLLASQTDPILECSIVNRYSAADTDLQLIRLELEGSPFFIPLENLKNVLTNKRTRYFMMYRTGYTAHYTTSKSLHYAAINSLEHSVVSADYCNPGTHKVVHILRPIRANSVEQLRETIRVEHAYRTHGIQVSSRDQPPPKQKKVIRWTSAIEQSPLALNEKVHSNDDDDDENYDSSSSNSDNSDYELDNKTTTTTPSVPFTDRDVRSPIRFSRFEHREPVEEKEGENTDEDSDAVEISQHGGFKPRMQDNPEEYGYVVELDSDREEVENNDDEHQYYTSAASDSSQGHDSVDGDEPS